MRMIRAMIIAVMIVRAVSPRASRCAPPVAAGGMAEVAARDEAEGVEGGVGFVMSLGRLQS